MKCVINYYCLLVIFLFASSSAHTYAQALSRVSTMHITVPLSDRMSYRFERYLLYAYNQLGYKVKFEELLTARAREMVDAGRFDGLMVAEKEIEQVYTNLLLVPVMLARGSLVLYCNREVNCQASVLNNGNNTVGVVSGYSMSANFMQKKQAATYAVKSSDNLGLMLSKGRLNYVLLVHEEQLGTIGDLDESSFQKFEVHSSEGYHFIHKKHQHLLADLTQALQLAIEKFGPLVEPSKIVNKY